MNKNLLKRAKCLFNETEKTHIYIFIFSPPTITNIKLNSRFLFTLFFIDEKRQWVFFSIFNIFFVITTNLN